jgi:WD40 repeat protein
VRERSEQTNEAEALARSPRGSHDQGWARPGRFALVPTSLTPSPTAQLSDHVTAIGWSADGSMVAAGSIGGDCVIAGGDGVVAKPNDHPMGVLALSWSPTAPRLAVGGQDGVVQVWSADSVESTKMRGWIQHVEWRKQGDLLAVSAGKDAVLLDGSLSEVARQSHPSTVGALTWTPDGQRLAVGAYGGVWWYEATGAPSKRFEWTGSLLTASISPNNKWIASGNQDSSIHCWKLWSGDDLAMAGYEAKITVLAWDPSSRFLAVGGIGDVTIWDFSGRGPAGSTPAQLVGHARRIVALGYRPRTAELASVGADGRVCLWDPTRKSKRLIAEVQLNVEATCAAWDPLGRQIAVGCADGQVITVTVS